MCHIRINKKIWAFLVFFTVVCTHAIEIVNPESPKDPGAEKTNITKKQYNIDFKKQDGLFYRGFTEGMTGFYLDKLTWEGNSEGNQAKLIDFVKSINIKGYKMSKRTAENLSVVYYIPYIFDIELKNGTMIKDAKGRIPQIDSFYVYDETGKEKCFTYFLRYWLEDKRIFSDNNSADYDETPPLPKELVTFIEFNTQKK
ncbi:MAG: hypothetical protein J6B11_05495 [Spirochaetales bacterium]|nr:hypothetical protein [Spirochaetales bacterium]